MVKKNQATCEVNDNVEQGETKTKKTRQKNTDVETGDNTEVTAKNIKKTKQTKSTTKTFVDIVDNKNTDDKATTLVTDSVVQQSWADEHTCNTDKNEPWNNKTYVKTNDQNNDDLNNDQNNDQNNDDLNNDQISDVVSENGKPPLFTTDESCFSDKQAVISADKTVSNCTEKELLEVLWKRGKDNLNFALRVHVVKMYRMLNGEKVPYNKYHSSNNMTSKNKMYDRSDRSKKSKDVTYDNDRRWNRNRPQYYGKRVDSSEL